MVFVRTDFKKMDLIPLSNLHAGRLDAGVHGWIEYDAAVLCRTDQMIQEDGDVMTLMQVYAHRSTLTSQQAAGYEP